MAPSEYPADPATSPPAWDDIVVGCFNDREARRFGARLSALGVGVRKVDGQNVHVPWTGDSHFLFLLMAAAVEGGHASDVVAAAAQHVRIKEIERRARWS